MKEFILDGNNFNDIDGFYNEIDKLLITQDMNVVWNYIKNNRKGV